MFRRTLVLILSLVIVFPAPAQAVSFTSLYEAARQRAQGLISTVMEAKFSFKNVIAATAIGALAGFVLYKLSNRNASQPVNAQIKNKKPAEKVDCISDITLDLLNGDIKQLREICSKMRKTDLNFGLRQTCVELCIENFKAGHCKSLPAVFVVINSLFEPERAIPGMTDLIKYLRKEKRLHFSLAHVIASAADDEKDLVRYCLIIKHALAHSLDERASIAQEIAPECGELQVTSDDHKKKIKVVLEKLFYTYKESKAAEIPNGVSVSNEILKYEDILKAWQSNPAWKKQQTPILSTEQKLEMELKKQTVETIKLCAPTRHSNKLDPDKSKRARRVLEDMRLEFRFEVGKLLLEANDQQFNTWAQIRAVLDEVLFPAYSWDGAEKKAYDTLIEMLASGDTAKRFTTAADEHQFKCHHLKK